MNLYKVICCDSTESMVQVVYVIEVDSNKAALAALNLMKEYKWPHTSHVSEIKLIASEERCGSPGLLKIVGS